MTLYPAAPLFSVVIPNYNGARYLEACLTSLNRQTQFPAEVILVDNASRDNSLEVVRRIAPRARILEQKQNLGFAGGVNAGIRVARGLWLAVLNSDAEVSETWLEECAAALKRHPDAAFLACRILDSKDRLRLYSAGDCFLRACIGYRRGQERHDGAQYHQEMEIFSACGCAALYRRSVFEDAGGYDERLFAYLEDVDLALSLQAAGYRGYYVPRAVVFHRGGATSGGEFSPLSVRLRTRNSAILLIQSVPYRVFWRCLPMILAGQASWLGRVIARGRLWSYLRGLAGILPLLPNALRRRRKMRRLWRESSNRLWRAILHSEAEAYKDFTGPRGDSRSWFLYWYFRVFRMTIDD